MATSFKKPKKKIDPSAADALAESLADKTYDEPVSAQPPEEKYKPMQFKVPARFHKEVKLFAMENDMTMTELFKVMFYEYRDRHS